MSFSRRAPQPQISEFIATNVVGAARTLVGAADAYRSLVRRRTEPGVQAACWRHACDLALIARGLVLFAPRIAEEVPEPASPLVALDVLRRLEYAFVALGQEPADERALLSDVELEELMGGPVERWIEGFRDVGAFDG